MAPGADYKGSAGSRDASFLLEAYWTCKDFETASRMKGGMDKSTRILGFEFECESPHDAATGHTSGRVKAKPVVIRKYLDASSPLIVNALVRNTNIEECKIAYYANKADGSGKVKQYELTLSKFHITRVHQLATNDATGVSEEIHLTYDKLIMLDCQSTKQAEYEWTDALA